MGGLKRFAVDLIHVFLTINHFFKFLFHFNMLGMCTRVLQHTPLVTFPAERSKINLAEIRHHLTHTGWTPAERRITLAAIMNTKPAGKR